MTNRKRRKNADPIDWNAVSHFDEISKPWRAFSLREKLKDPKYAEAKEMMVDTLTGKEFRVEYMQRTGFTRPVFVAKRDDLGLKIPRSFHSREFHIDMLRSAIGSRKIVDALEARTQRSKSMTMKDWCKYWQSEPRKVILNGISLEFSLTKLDPQIVSPRVVRQVDWISKAWPRHLKELQTDNTNNIAKMMYPKVQKFVVMSTAGSFMDFHIDFGGTSVWYYLLKGHKIFWLIPPTDKNLLLYRQWVKNSRTEGEEKVTEKMDDNIEEDKGVPITKTEWFGDQAEGCCRIELAAGNTLFMPGGWIHAVYTPKDSIAFSGSFLHSFAVEKQIQVNYLEESLGVLEKYRFPFFTEIMWYVLDRYVTCLKGKSNLDLPEEEKTRIRLEKGENVDANQEFLNPGLVDEAVKAPTDHVHLTQAEIIGLKYIIFYLSQRPPDLKNVPVLLPNPAQLVRDVKQLLKDHMKDCPQKAVTGKYILRWTEDDNVEEDSKIKKIIPKPKDVTGELPDNPFYQRYLKSTSGLEGVKKAMDVPKKRRIRCMECSGCKTADCRTCPQCRDMPKYGGSGRMKQTCVKRRCSKPMLPVAAACSICSLDGWLQTPDPKKPWPDKITNQPDLMECTICLEIVHPKCSKKPGKVVAGLSNSWECHDCGVARSAGQQAKRPDAGQPSAKEDSQTKDASNSESVETVKSSQASVEAMDTTD